MCTLQKEGKVGKKALYRVLIPVIGGDVSFKNQTPKEDDSIIYFKPYNNRHIY